MVIHIIIMQWFLFIVSLFICSGFYIEIPNMMKPLKLHLPLLEQEMNGLKQLLESRNCVKPDTRTTITTFGNPSIVSKMNGFYGLIGPDIHMSSVKSLYDLFIGDGIIQGIFIENGAVTFVKHRVRTEKLCYESMHGLFSKNIRMLPIYMAAYKMGMLPNVLGLANTAFLKVEKNIYTVFERDYPYKIIIDIENKQISTDKKVYVEGVNSLSGHSKYKDGTIHSIDYNILSNSLYYHQFDSKFKKKSHVLIQTKYIPLIHDFYLFSSGEIILVDSPLEFDLLRTFPVIFNNKNPTYIHIYNSTTLMTTTYTCSQSFYLFHYADVIKRDNTIEVYAPLYDRIDFMSLNLEGRYRRLVIDVKTKEVTIQTNPEFENMNVDFPKKWKEFVILRYIEKNVISGFIICKELEIIKRIVLPENRYFCGEHELLYIDGSTFLVGFSYDNRTNGYFSMINITDSYEYFEIPLYTNLTIGFHSIFL